MAGYRPYPIDDAREYQMTNNYEVCLPIGSTWNNQVNNGRPAEHMTNGGNDDVDGTIIREWCCDLCSEAFGDFEDARTHEVLCRFRQQQELRFRIDQNEPDQREPISSPMHQVRHNSDHRREREDVDHCYLNQQRRGLRGDHNIELEKTAKEKTPSIPSSSKNDKWKCDKCMEAKFHSYVDAFVHEKFCTGVYQATLGDRNSHRSEPELHWGTILRNNSKKRHAKGEGQSLPKGKQGTFATQQHYWEGEREQHWGGTLTNRRRASREAEDYLRCKHGKAVNVHQHRYHQQIEKQEYESLKGHHRLNTAHGRPTVSTIEAKQVRQRHPQNGKSTTIARKMEKDIVKYLCRVCEDVCFDDFEAASLHEYSCTGHSTHQRAYTYDYE